MYQMIQSPIKIGQTTLKNRVVFAPTSLGLSKEETIQKIRKVAAGGVGLIIIGDIPVVKSRMPSLRTRKGFRYFEKLVEAAHAEGAKISAQLFMSDMNIKLLRKYIPSLMRKKMTFEEVKNILISQIGPYISAMPARKINKILNGFYKSAQLAKKAGFDMIQVHGDRMCGSMSSVLYNKREDQYGGSLENRIRFLKEAIVQVQLGAEDLPIDVKLPVRLTKPHYGNAGVEFEELKEVVPILEKAGADSFHVTLANHSNLSDIIPPKKHKDFGEEGCFLFLCDEVKKYTNLPVCGVGGLVTPQFVEEQLRKGRIQLAGMSRALIADDEWYKKLVSNKEDQIKKCVRCNQKCLGGMLNHQGVHCIFDKES